MAFPRRIIFVDPPAFCTTVEGLVAPALRHRPVAVAAPGADRATVLALSAEARAAGISRGMPVRQARKRCPDLMLVPPNPALYARASRALHEILSRYAPVIEPRGYGHAFLDVTGTTGLFGPAVDLTARIQREARQRLSLPLSAGVAVNKLVSQAAATVIKEVDGRTGGQADGKLLYQVDRGDECVFLAPRPVAVMPDLDADVRRRLDEYQLELIGEIAAIERRQLSAVFGAEGVLLHERSHGIDLRPVLPPERRAEFRAAHTLATDTNDHGVLYPLLRRLTERLGHQLRLRHLTAARLTVSLAYSDYATARRQVPLTRAALDMELWDAARRAFGLACQRTIAIRAVGVTVDRLTEEETQLLLELGCGGGQGGQDGRALPPRPPATERHWDAAVCGPAARESFRAPPAALQGAIDTIRKRWGEPAVRIGRTPVSRLPSPVSPATR
jgi:DNA polymerase-4